MYFPKELVDTLDMALIEVLNDPHHELLLPTRQKIWELLGPKLITKFDTIHGIGLYRRTYLAILCVEHVLHIWEKKHPTNKRPHHMIYLAEKYIKKEVDSIDVNKQYDIFFAYLENTSDIISRDVGDAARNAVITAMHDETIYSNNLEYELLETGYCFEHWDASYYASLAYAGGFPGDEHSDKQRRKEFWEWYLKTAVLTAWKQGSRHVFLETW